MPKKIEISSEYQAGDWVSQVGFKDNRYYGRLTKFRGSETVWLPWEPISCNMLAYIDRETGMVESKYAEKYMDLCS